MTPRTRRLYHEDPALLVFRARVVSERSGPGGTWDVVLDETAFYPTGGGQPHDLGVLGGVAVLDVFEEGDAVVHRLAARPPGEVEGRVDRARRLDHRRQHTGQHILSRAFLETAGAATVGFHLGAEHCTIDLDRGDLGEQDLDRAEARANEVVLQDVPVEAAWYASADLLPPDLRRETELAGPLRVVSVGSFDRNACCGTHCSRSGEVGPVKILAMEKKKGGARVEFLCGERALGDHRRRHRALRAAGRLLTTGDLQVPERVAALREELRGVRTALATAEAELRERLVAEAARGSGPASVDVGPGREAWLVDIANAVAARRGAAVLATSREEDGVRVAAVVPGAHAGNLLRDLLAEAGGRGGGPAGLGQGRVPASGLPRLLEAWAARATGAPEPAP
jgi:alanyl-tRNA synthetase